MSKPELTVAKKNAMTRYEKEALRGTRLKKESVLFSVTPDRENINYSFTIIYCSVKCVGKLFRID